MEAPNLLRFEEEDVVEGSIGGPYMVEKIVGIFMGQNRKKYYRVKWIDSWEPEENLSEACQPLIDDFWTGKTFDSHGKEVSKAELKSGQKVIKKEIVQQQQQQQQLQSKDSSDNHQQTTTSQSHDISTTNPSSVLKLKAELSSPTDKNPPSLSSIATTTITTATTTTTTIATSTTTSTTLLKKELATNTTNTPQSSSANPSITSRANNTENLTNSQQHSQTPCCHNQKTKAQLAVVQKSPVKTTDESTVPTSSTATNTNARSEVVQRRSIDGQTQTENIVDQESDCVLSEHNNHLLARDSPSSGHLSPQRDVYGGSDDVVDIVSEEEDIEITVSIESPNRTKKRRLTNLSPSTKGYHSAPQLRRKGREKTTKRRNQYAEDNGLISLQHPRSLLSTFPASCSESSPQSSLSKESSSSLSRSNEKNSHVSATTSSFLTKNKAITERTCNICKYTFPNLTRARKHMKEAHNQQQQQQQQQKQPQPQPNIQLAKSSISDHTCSVCFGVFRNNRDLKSHMLLHTDHKHLHKCNVCLRTFRNKNTLQQHQLIHSEELPHECDTCGKRFRQQGHLIVHMAIHSKNDEGYFLCPYCTRTFVNDAIFRDHVRTHEAELPFGCNQCQERFEDKAMLMTHLEWHNEGKPFSCPICKKSFKTKTYLSGHMQMHRLNNTEPHK